VERAEVIYLDTHVLVRLYQGEIEKLSESARREIERHDLLVSPAAILELEYLHEIGRLEPSATKLMGTLAMDLRTKVCEIPFQQIVEHALKEKWSRDPFDRLIVAHAKAGNAALISKDENIRRHYRRAVW
jgi:PIN domain nuclease of toxin-antitoxin system